MNSNCYSYSPEAPNLGQIRRFLEPCDLQIRQMTLQTTVYPKKYALGFCFAVLCCGYTLTDFPISIRLTSLVLWQSNDCPSASKATLMNMDIYFMWIQYERLHNHNKAKHNKTVCIFLGIYCRPMPRLLAMIKEVNILKKNKNSSRQGLKPRKPQKSICWYGDTLAFSQVQIPWYP